MNDKSKYVKRSSYRVKVLKAIGDDIKIPTEIANDSGILRNHISNVLRDLKEHDLVECLNPKSRKGRLYRLSKEGFEVLEDLEQLFFFQFCFRSCVNICKCGNFF